MTSLAILGLVGLTSLVAYIAGTRASGLRRDGLPGAMREALECLGLAALFLAGNVMAGLGLILGRRALTGEFVSVYGLSDTTLAVLSFVQALVLHSWRRRSK